MTELTLTDEGDDTIQAFLCEDGDIAIRNETSDQGTSVTIILTKAQASALGVFLTAAGV